MSDKVDISMVGNKELERKLHRLDIQLQRKIVRGSMRKAMRQVRDEARNLAPVRTGRLQRSIKQQQRTRRGVTRASIVTGERRELGIPANARGYYPAALEYGYRRNGRHIPGRSFMRRALYSKRSGVLRDLADDINRGIMREVRR